MLSFAGNLIILGLTLAASLAFTLVMNRLWPVERRYSESDLVGWQLSVLGTTYAVTLGFMLYTEWGNFRAAELNVELEANSLRNIYRLAQGLTTHDRAAIEKLTITYATDVVERDWPEMAAGRLPEESHEANEQLWKALLSAGIETPIEIAAHDHAISELSMLTQHRRTRILDSKYRLPTIFWCVLFSGGVLTVISVSIFGSRQPRIHMLQVVSLTLLLTLVMLTIADIDKPFQGWVHVSDYAFRRAIDTMREIR
jgi:Protein of unknown function (DUF4239)